MHIAGTEPIPGSLPRVRSAPLKSKTRLRLIVSAAALALMAASGFAFNSAWQQTRLSEAYLPALETMARRSPTDGQLLALLGARLMEAGEMDAAADTLRRALSAGDDADEVWLCLAAANAARGQRGAALVDLATARRLKGETTALRAAQARVDATAGRGAGAETDAVLAQALSPHGQQPILDTHATGSFLNGVSQWWGRRHAETSGYATRLRWIRQRPQDAQALRLWGLALELNRRMPEAGAALSQALAIAPASPAAHLAMADFLFQVAPPAKAGLEYIAALKRRPDWLPALLGLGHVGSSERLKYAAAAYKRATVVAPHSVEAWVGLGRAYSQSTMDNDQAAAAFATAARLAPERTDFFGPYADALRQNSRWPEAEGLLRRRLKAAPDDAFSHYLVGRVLLDSHPSAAREAEAARETRESLRLVPHAPEAADQLAAMLLAQGRIPEALPLLKTSLSDDPYNTNTLNTLARAYHQNGQTALAASMTARARAVAADQQQKAALRDQEHMRFTDPHLHDQLAVLYSRGGRPDRAQQEQEIARLLRSDPARIKAQEESLNSDLEKLLAQDTSGGK